MPSQSRSSVQRTHSLPVHSSPQAILMFPPGEVPASGIQTGQPPQLTFVLSHPLSHPDLSQVSPGYAPPPISLCLCPLSLLGLSPLHGIPYLPSAYMSFLSCATVTLYRFSSYSEGVESEGSVRRL